MNLCGNRLYKREKLCSDTAIDKLFAAGRANKGVAGELVNSAVAYPWRAMWTVNESRRADNPQFLISVPKKRLRHAVDRVQMRRRCREAYRLNRNLLDMETRLDIAFIYIADGLSAYDRTERSMRKLLSRITQSLHPDETDAPQDS